MAWTDAARAAAAAKRKAQADHMSGGHRGGVVVKKVVPAPHGYEYKRDGSLKRMSPVPTGGYGSVSPAQQKLINEYKQSKMAKRKSK